MRGRPRTIIGQDGPFILVHHKCQKCQDGYFPMGYGIRRKCADCQDGYVREFVPLKTLSEWMREG